MKIISEELIEISKVLINNPHVNILSDDIYEHISYDKSKYFTVKKTNC